MNKVDFHIHTNASDGSWNCEDDLIPSEKVIEAIKDAGGIAILAHPSYYFPGNIMPEEMLDKYVEWGIDGIECYSSYNPEKEQKDPYF